MSALGSNIVQIMGDVTVTHIENTPESTETSTATKLSKEQRLQLAALTGEVVVAEGGHVPAKVVRASMNAYIGVKSVDEMTVDMYPRAQVYLIGWRNCAAEGPLTHDAMVSQVIRIWTVAPTLKGPILEFAKWAFGRELLRGMTSWELRSTLAFAMSKWQTYWQARNASSDRPSHS